MCGGEAVSDFGVLTPRGGWGEKGWMVGGQMKLAVPTRTDWTAFGALDWGFPHSYHSLLHTRGLGGSGRTHQRLLLPGCGALQGPRIASECRERRYFPELAAGSPSGCFEFQVASSRHRAAAVDVAAADDGGDGGGGGDG